MGITCYNSETIPVTEIEGINLFTLFILILIGQRLLKVIIDYYQI